MKRPGSGISAASVLTVFTVGLTMRIWHLAEIRSAHFFRMKLGDALSYHNWALDLVNNSWIGTEVFYQAPLYPYALAVSYRLLGTDRLTVVGIQAVLGAMSCVLICDATTRLHSRAAGIAAGLILACYAPSIFFDSLIQKTAADQFLLCLLINLAVRWQGRPNLRTSVLAGLSLGLLILSRENAMVLLVPMATGMVLHRRPDYRAGVVSVMMLGLGLSAVLLPVAVRNHAVGGEFHLTTSQFGPNFFIGNNRSANGMYQPLRVGGGNAERERGDATLLAEQDLGRRLTPGEVSEYWTKRTLRDISESPARWLRLLCWKTALLWNRVEVTDTEDPYTYAEWSLPLRLLLPFSHFGVLLPLATLGYLLERRHRRQLHLLVLMTGCYAAGVLLFYVFGRYRFPLVPMLCPLAAIGITDAGRLLHHLWTTNGFRFSALFNRRGIGTISVVTSVAVLSNWPFLSEDRMKSISFYNFAVELDLQGRINEAAQCYQRTLELNPSDVDAYVNLADVQVRSGQLARAAQNYEAALQFETAPVEIHFELANLCAAMGQTAAAVRHYHSAIQAMPDLAAAHLNLGVALQHQGQTSEAIQALQRAVSLDDAYPAAHLNLAHLLASTGRYQQAAVHYQRVLQLVPGMPVAERCLGEVNELLRKEGSAP